LQFDLRAASLGRGGLGGHYSAVAAVWVEIFAISPLTVSGVISKNHFANLQNDPIRLPRD